MGILQLVDMKMIAIGIGLLSSIISYQAAVTSQPQVTIKDIMDYGFAIAVAIYLLHIIAQIMVKKMDKVVVNVEKVMETQKYIANTLKDVTETLRQISDTNTKIIYMIESMQCDIDKRKKR